MIPPFSFAPLPPPPAPASNVPGALSGFAVPNATTNTAILQFAPPPSGGMLDQGTYRPQFKKSIAQTWTDTQSVFYCTPTLGSSTDIYNNVWAINSGYVVTVNGVAITSAFNAVRLLLVNQVAWYQDISANLYNYSPSGYIDNPNSPTLVWAGAYRTSPLMKVIISGLAPNTSYDFRVFVSNSVGSGPVTTTITKSTGI